MTRLLASVTSVQEARVVIRAGADIVDLKDPAAGALGALPVARIQSVVDDVAGRCPVSATVGDLPAEPELLSNAVRATADTGVDFVKVGLFDREHLRDCLPALARHAAAGLRLVAVLFADRPREADAVSRIAGAGFSGVMLDTADKKNGNLREHLSPAQLSAFVDEARQRGLLTGLAGSLCIEDIAPLLATGSDYLGFRSALCGGQARTAGIDPAAVAAVRACLPQADFHQAIGSDISTRADPGIARVDHA